MQYFAVEGSDYVSNRYDFITNEADERPSANAKFGNILYCKDTGNEYIYDGSTWQEYKMRYKDLGLVIDAVNVAAGAVILTAEINNAQWVRNIVIQTIADQLIDVRMYKEYATGQFDYGVIATNIPTGTAQRVFTLANAVIVCGIGDKKIKFAIKNAGASIATSVKLYVRLFD